VARLYFVFAVDVPTDGIKPVTRLEADSDEEASGLFCQWLEIHGVSPDFMMTDEIAALARGARSLWRMEGERIPTLRLWP